MSLRPFSRKVPEHVHDLLIDLALERYDKERKFLHRLPIPGVEFRLVAVRRRIDCDFTFVAVKAKGEPALLLASIPAFQCDTDQMGGEIVANPAGGFGQ
jgi:hypothetical protein